MAAITPEERAADESAKPLGTDPTATLKGKMSQIGSLPEDQQRSICLLLAGEYAGVGQEDAADAAKAERQDAKKREKSKGWKRVAAVRPVAARLGVKLP